MKKWLVLKIKQKSQCDQSLESQTKHRLGEGRKCIIYTTEDLACKRMEEIRGT